MSNVNKTNNKINFLLYPEILKDGTSEKKVIENVAQFLNSVKWKNKSLQSLANFLHHLDAELLKHVNTTFFQKEGVTKFMLNGEPTKSFQIYSKIEN
jgi:hypothetical protein